ncbi:SusC/RagA family TonB-linked outer membrane protein [Dinghuibacter silviterrae]|uniref:TonB-linked SusC/RagA family outer membrane protein n=1 Tax=Dinghuibacter silviterrae TaxID=1539049 RepID=A0A4V3GLW0_9BACT|nr:TonB-dependent receptor [Dinghuibacter silviterrae]TDX00983.1 TonB-linked SusC/RagA family outer membrane protein [Dinghuibacter silviterrae]
MLRKRSDGGRLAFPRRALLCLILTASVQVPLLSQGNPSPRVEAPATASLKEVFEYLSHRFGLKLSYDAALAGAYKVSFGFDKETDGMAALRKALAQTDLTFTEKGSYVVIVKRPAPGHKKIAEQAQPVHEFSGTVRGGKGEVLAGATVRIKGTDHAVLTDETGRFDVRFDGPSADVMLEISMSGYDPQLIKVSEGEPVSVLMRMRPAQLDPVVVVGYGSQKRSVVSGAVTQVQLDKLDSRSVNNIGDVLQGKAPGVIVTNNGGDPTVAPSVYIRGMGGINGESALYVVDGSIVSGTPALNPNEIQSISVLKDATASIYGARASGGVIFITTKRGSQDEPKVSFDVKVGVQSAWRKLEPLNAQQFANVVNLADDNAVPQVPRNPAFNASVYPDGQVTRTNWMDDIFQHGLIQDYTAGVSGGRENSNFYMGFGYRKTDGILLNTYNQRFTFRLNSDWQVKPWLKVGENMSFSSLNGTGANTTDDYQGAIINAIFYPPSVAPYTSTGAFAGLPAQYAGSYGDVINPVAYLKRLQVSDPVLTITLNPYVEATILPGLTFRSNFSYTPSFTYYKNFTDKVLEIGKIFDYNELDQKVDDYADLLAEQTLTYNHTFKGGHHLTLTGGYSYQDTRKSFLYVYVQGFNDQSPQYQYVQNGSNILTGGNNTQSGFEEQALISNIGRINYDYRGKYLLTLIGRRDGTSLVAQQNRFKNYGSVSGGWVASKESFLKDATWLSNLKLRASYGILGNLGSLPVSAVNAPLTQTVGYIGSPATLMTGYSADYLPNPNLDWANSKQLNLGIDLGVLQNRLTLVADYFIKTTDNMLLLVQTPPTTGVAYGQYQNGGSDRDKGIELGLTYNSDPHADFQYSVNANITSVTDKLLALPGGQTNIPTDNLINVRTILDPLYIHTGYPLYSYYLIKNAGTFKTQAEIDNYVDKSGNKIQPNARPGDLKFVDANGDGKIDNNDRVVETGAFPKFTYGFSFNASYKHFDLNIFAQGSYGNKLFNSLKYTAYNAGTGQNYNMLKGVLGAWSPANPNSNIPIISASDNNGNFSNTSDWYLESGSYLRIKNVTLGYTLPETVAHHLGLAGLRVYVTSNNFLTFTKYGGFDPEVGMNQYGVDMGLYPQARSFMGGLNVNF